MWHNFCIVAYGFVTLQNKLFYRHSIGCQLPSNCSKYYRFGGHVTDVTELELLSVPILELASIIWGSEFEFGLPAVELEFLLTKLSTSNEVESN